jgi:predicted enzyme related to lactoylglutathione lyase
MADVTNAVNWFEIPVDDLERAKEFYESVLGVELALNEMGPAKMAWFPMHQGAPGSTGALVKSEGYTPSHAGTVVYLHVDDVEAALAQVDASGGKTLVPKTGIGEYGFIGQFEDSEGNRVALHSNT